MSLIDEVNKLAKLPLSELAERLREGRDLPVMLAIMQRGTDAQNGKLYGDRLDDVMTLASETEQLFLNEY